MFNGLHYINKMMLPKMFKLSRFFNYKIKQFPTENKITKLLVVMEFLLKNI